MSQQIVQQPDGKFAIWSSVVDNFILVDAENAQEIIDELVEDARQSITAKVNDIITALHRGDKPYHQSTKSFDDCIALIREIHGDDTETLKHFR